MPRLQGVLGEPAGDRRRRRSSHARSTTAGAAQRGTNARAGRPAYAGSEQATAFTSATCSGGKCRGRVPVAVDHEDHPAAPRRSVSATTTPSQRAVNGDAQSPRWSCPGWQATTMFACNTSWCGTVYLAARERNSRDSSALNTMSNGLFAMAPSSTPAAGPFNQPCAYC